MTETVTDPVAESEPGTKRAVELEAGDWLAPGVVHPKAVCVQFVHRFDDRSSTVAVVWTTTLDGPGATMMSALKSVRLATHAEINPPPPFAAIAEELHRIADDLATLTDLSDPPYFTINIQPAPRDQGDAATVAVVDAVTTALLGKPGHDQAMRSGDYHYSAGGQRGLIQVDVRQSISGPTHCPESDCGEPMDQIESGRVGHCGIACCPEPVAEPADETGTGYSDPGPWPADPRGRPGARRRQQPRRSCRAQGRRASGLRRRHA